MICASAVATRPISSSYSRPVVHNVLPDHGDARADAVCSKDPVANHESGGRTIMAATTADGCTG